MSHQRTNAGLMLVALALTALYGLCASPDELPGAGRSQRVSPHVVASTP